MRALLLPLLLLATACRQEEPAATESPTQAGGTEVFASGPRDRLCLKPGERRVGIITYAAGGDANCSLRGQTAEPFLIRPDGDEACEITYRRHQNGITLSQVGAACAYYCGPGATLEGKAFAKTVKPDEAKDLAGDPLC